MADITVIGVEKICERLDGILNANNLESAMGKACALVEREAKRKAPHRTGELRRSIASKVEDGGTVGIVYTPLEYAPYVEFGTGLFASNGNGRKDVPWAYRDEESGELIFTSGQHPQPFLGPALNENRQEIIRILREALKKND